MSHLSNRLLLLAALAALPLATARGQAADPEGAPAAQGAADPQVDTTMLCMHDGSLLWGRIEDHDVEGLAFRRLDTGGLLRLDWGRLDPAHADRLREELGYVEGSSEEVMTEADRLVLVDGSELIGRIVNRTEGELWIKTSSATVPVPKLRLAGPATTVQVPALDVYTPEELYRQELADLETGDAASHLRLALFCERVLAFEQAVEHLERAAALESSLQPEELSAHLERLRRKLANQEQVEVLRDIDRQRARGRFDAALELARGFAERFPESPLLQDASRKELQVERSMEKALADRVGSLWHHWARKLVREQALQPEPSLEASLAWVDDALSEGILTRVHAELARSVSSELTPEEVRRYFDEREGGRWQKATYGEGTWLLGEADALAGLPETATGDEPQSERDEERERMAERIRRYLKNQEVIRRAKSVESGSGDDEQQRFWERWSSNGRAGWLLAYYAENGGDMQLREPTFRNCTQCGGKGVREVINTGSARSNTTRSEEAGSSNSTMVACPTCKHLGKWRTVSFR